ncbi:alcohol dehydrogenase catalytic domain-containing protein [Pseudomonas putida]|uniref:Alcohol dehydrogenase catalytic domain-containing protein n=1 Tax=Pseudomonas putida TaxID=303 RepID=A0AAP9MXS1_PSEPU|nr:alcohol dehydrogenase catalytic domain-containing protein [Pseudomonas putida]QJQ09772.1 alcohol dehydrogenase catalytic domain-containing protein [Pseudomonas putida]
MKAITFETFGGPEVLQVSEVPVPEVRPADLLVRVHAAGVNRADLTHRTGGYGRPNFGDSLIIGLEISGEVIEIGTEVSGYQVGDRVMGVVGGGAYAEIARIDYRMAMPITIYNDCDELDYCERCVSPDGQRRDFDPGDRTDPVALLSTWEHRSLERMLKAL